MKEKRISIYVSCFNNNILLPENSLFKAVQTGSANAKTRFSGILHDDEGENISLKNPRFNDASTQYWAWKNQENDYYGFFQYRRFLSFDESILPAKEYEKMYPANVEEAFEDMRLSDESYMRSIIEKYDVITCNPLDYGNYYSLYEQFRDGDQHNIEDLDTILSIIQRKYPEYVEAAQKYIFGGIGYFANLFIMKKEYFFRYCEWAFDILTEFDNTKDYSTYNAYQSRIVGFLSERLLGIFYTYLKSTTDCKFGELQKCFFNTTRELPIEPACQDRSVPVFMITSQYYIPYTNVLIQSIIRNASDRRNYDIVVFHQDLSSSIIRKAQGEVNKENISIRFVNIASYFTDEDYFVRGHFSVETYFRFAMQDVFENYKKVIYLDSDMVVQTDIAELFDIDMEGFPVAAVQDADSAGLYNGFDPLRKKYVDRVLKFKDNPYEYFQAGVIVFNLPEFNKLVTSEKLFALAKSQNWDLIDQDILNFVCYGRVKFIDMSWNVMADWDGVRINGIIKNAPEYLYEQYMEARKQPKIIHFAGPKKPWDDNDFAIDMEEYFWEYANDSTFYASILERREMEKEGHIFETSDIEKTGVVESSLNKVFPLSSKRRENIKRLVGKKVINRRVQTNKKPVDILAEENPIQGSGLVPAFDGNSIPVILTSSNYFSIYMSVTIQSIIENTSIDNNYDIVILHQNISKENIRVLESQAQDKKNISIRFVDVSDMLKHIQIDTKIQFSKELFVRPLLDKILDNYDKVVFVDSDMIVREDVAKLYDMELGNNLLAAVQDICFSVFYKRPDPKIKESYDIKPYIDDVLQFKDAEKVFNAGLMVFNLSGFRVAFSAARVINTCNAKKWPYADQDILNVICRDRVLFIPHEWNYRTDVLYANLNIGFSTSVYNRIKGQTKIIHYAGGNKPWNTPNLQMGSYFWEVAKTNPFLAEILLRCSKETSEKLDGYLWSQSAHGKKHLFLQKLLPEGGKMKRVVNKLLPEGSKSRAKVKKVVEKLLYPKQ